MFNNSDLFKLRFKSSFSIFFFNFNEESVKSRLPDNKNELFQPVFWILEK